MKFIYTGCRFEFDGAIDTLEKLLYYNRLESLIKCWFLNHNDPGPIISEPLSMSSFIYDAMDYAMNVGTTDYAMRRKKYTEFAELKMT